MTGETVPDEVVLDPNPITVSTVVVSNEDGVKVEHVLDADGNQIGTNVSYTGGAG